MIPTFTKVFFYFNCADNRLSDDDEEMMATATIHPDSEEMVMTEKWTKDGEVEDSPQDRIISNLDIVETTTSASSSDDPDTWEGKMDEEMIMTVTPEEILESRHLHEGNSESQEESATNGDCNGKHNGSDHHVLFDLVEYGLDRKSVV